MLAEIVRQGRLVWQLLLDSRVPVGVKSIPLFVLLYLISPIDMLPDPILGLGQLDDLAVILLGLNLFIRMSPSWIVQQYRDMMGAAGPAQKGSDSGGTEAKPIIDATYRVLDEDAEEQQAEEGRSS